MMLSKSVFLCAFRDQNNPQNPKYFLENIQFEGLCTLLFLGQIVVNRVIKQCEFGPWILEKNHKPMTCPELKNISLTFWVIQKTSFRFGGQSH